MVSGCVVLLGSSHAAVAERDVLSDWWAALGAGSIVLAWGDKKAIGSLRIATLAELPKEIVDADGILLVRRG